ncbi:DNA adenine methylase, partial [Pseudomonas syringae]
MLIDESQNNIGLGEDYPKSIKGESLSSYLPITRYYGSKRRVIDWVKESVSCLEFDSVLDVFGGTATVSLMFKAMGKKVFYNDILMSS